MSFKVICENRDHDTIAVHLFQRRLVSFLAEHFGTKAEELSTYLIVVLVVQELLQLHKLES